MHAEPVSKKLALFLSLMRGLLVVNPGGSSGIRFALLVGPFSLMGLEYHHECVGLAEVPIEILNKRK